MQVKWLAQGSNSMTRKYKTYIIKSIEFYVQKENN